MAMSAATSVAKKGVHELAAPLVERLLHASSVEPAVVIKDYKSSEAGLSTVEVQRRLLQYGTNEVANERSTPWLVVLLRNFKDPLSLLLLVLGVVSYATGDAKATVLITIMVVLSITLRFVQEIRADKAAEKLKAMVRTTATVTRGGATKEIPLKLVVPGDVVHLSAGDMVPADVRLIESRDLFINQATLTGESLPVEKHAPPQSDLRTPLDAQNLCFMGTDVESGTASALVLSTGRETYFGSLAANVASPRELTSFDIGVNRFTWLIIRFIFVMVPLVFVVNWVSKGDWLEAFLFAMAVAVGLTPELLPVIVTVNLSKGALDMSRRKVIVKRLNAIQNFGAMDILCTDKTGTLTEGRVVLIKHVDIEGHENESILQYAYLNSFYQTGLKNLIDHAVLKHAPVDVEQFARTFHKVDEVPFDFVRRRMSVVVEDKDKQHWLICKGAVEEVLGCTTHVQVGSKVMPISDLHHKRRQSLADELNSEGFRLVALAIRKLPPAKQVYGIKDESNLTLLGFLAFLDPPKPTVANALVQLKQHGVGVKVLTGDSELVTRKICSEVGHPVTRILRGDEVQRMSDAELEQAAEESTVFDKLEPGHKERVIRALQRKGHVVGFLGDGINDAPALKAADVGISVDSAVDIARESSDIILLEKSLLVLKEGVREGRRIFANIEKYIKMAASSNFGNMFSVVGGSIFLPFLPMTPLQVITNNLLYDFSQVTIPTDGVDEEYVTKPRRWNIGHIQRFIMLIGPISSLFDYATFFLMLWVFRAWLNPTLFHTGWFVESILTQTLIIHVIRTKKIPFIQSRASWSVTLSTLIVSAVAIWLPFSPLAPALGFVPLPPLYWMCIGGFLLCYVVLTQFVKRWYMRYYSWD